MEEAEAGLAPSMEMTKETTVNIDSKGEGMTYLYNLVWCMEK